MSVHEGKLEAVEEKAQHASCFTDDEKAVIKEIIRIYRGWLFFVKVIKGTSVVIGGIIGFIAALVALLKGLGLWPPT